MRLIFYYITLILKCQGLQRWKRTNLTGRGVVLILMALMGGQLLVGSASAANTENFYFSDFTADYYLSKDSEGVSHLRVVEQLTAEFPDYNQNKGIRREIPFTNQDGANVVLQNLSRGNITVLRNGEPEPIWDIYQGGDYYVVEIGTDDYVLGTQIYTLEYEFEKVVTDFGNHQELYWDTNGTGWRQRFDSVTARVHLEDDIYDDFTGKSWCYVGSYSANDQGRCKMFKISDGMEFVATGLSGHENLTFDMEMQPGVFTVPEPEKDYTLLIIAGIVTAGCLGLLVYKIMKYQGVAEKIKEYNGIFVAPQYQPHSEYGLAEMAEIYLDKKKDVKVGILLDLVVKKKVELVKKGDAGVEIKSKWALRVKDVNDLSKVETIVLRLLANELSVSEGDVIELKTRAATSMLKDLGKQFDKTVLDGLKEKKLVGNKYKIGNTGSLGMVGSWVSALFEAAFAVGCVVFVLIGMTDGEIANMVVGVGKDVVLGKEAVLWIIAVIFVTATLVFWMSRRIKIISEVTTEGMKASKYMEGLKLYIKMAEADRMKMLQSVEGADISPEGIVKLYEKLLPYAAVFGLEESWMNEMHKYCNAVEIEEPNYLMMNMAVSDFSRAMRSAAGYASSAGQTIAGGGSFSSSSSGGGGGGFSGGGGGGGGGGGR